MEPRSGSLRPAHDGRPGFDTRLGFVWASRYGWTQAFASRIMVSARQGHTYDSRQKLTDDSGMYPCPASELTLLGSVVQSAACLAGTLCTERNPHAPYLVEQVRKSATLGWHFWLEACGGITGHTSITAHPLAQQWERLSGLGAVRSPQWPDPGAPAIAQRVSHPRRQPVAGRDCGPDMWYTWLSQACFRLSRGRV